jgi:tetratricopeptide (TPR) repeat protein
MSEMDVVTRARQLERQASTAQREGRFYDADAPLLAAIALWKTLHGPDHIEVLNDEMNLAVALRRRGEAARSVPLLESVAERLVRCADPDAPALLLVAQNNLATAYRDVGRLSLARRVYEASLARLDALHGPKPDEQRARVLDNLSVVLREVGDAVAAEASARRGLAEWRALRGDLDAETATAKGAVGAALLDQGKLDAAEPFLVEALVTHEATGHDLAVASTLTLVGALAFRRGDRGAAHAAFSRALALTRRFYPSDHREVQEILASLAAIDQA